MLKAALSPLASSAPITPPEIMSCPFQKNLPTMSMKSSPSASVRPRPSSAMAEKKIGSSSAQVMRPSTGLPLWVKRMKVHSTKAGGTSQKP